KKVQVKVDSNHRTNNAPIIESRLRGPGIRARFETDQWPENWLEPRTERAQIESVGEAKHIVDVAEWFIGFERPPDIWQPVAKERRRRFRGLTFRKWSREPQACADDDGIAIGFGIRTGLKVKRRKEIDFCKKRLHISNDGPSIRQYDWQLRLDV